MKRLIIITFTIMGIALSCMDTNADANDTYSSEQSLNDKCLIINPENLNLQIPYSDYSGTYLSLTLHYNPELKTWTLAPDTLTTCERSTDQNEASVVIRENLNIEVACADLLGTCFSFILIYSPDLAVWSLDSDTFLPCEQNEDVGLMITAQANPATGTLPLTTSFSCTVDSGNPPYNYTWNFGDGSIENNEENPSHTYESAGDYTATLLVTDAKGQKSEKSFNIEVRDNENKPPYFPSKATSYTVTNSSTSYSYDAYGNPTGSTTSRTETLHLSRKAVDPEGDDLYYTWEIIAGNATITSGAHSSEVAVKVDRYYYSYIKLTVEDSAGNSIVAIYKI